MSQRIYLIFHGRFPSEKAAALFTAHNADAFEAQGMRVTVLAPRRLACSGASAKEAYRLSKEIDTVYLPTLDLFGLPIVRKAAYYLSLFAFSVSTYFFLLFHARRGDIVYSNEPLPLMLAPFFLRRMCYELHDYPEHNNFFYRYLFHRVAHTLVTNRWKLERAQKEFSRSAHKMFLEQNAVSLKDFTPALSQAQARERIGLPQEGKIILYTGHLYSWKGVDVLAEAARELSTGYSVYFVGGTEEDISDFRTKWGSQKNITIAGHRPHAEIPLWQRAADVLVLPNTAKEAISQFYTSPMKLFEYMASGTPIVASNLPSIVEILTSERGMLVEADNPQALAKGIIATLADIQASARAKKAQEWVADHSWEKRAARILERIV